MKNKIMLVSYAARGGTDPETEQRRGFKKKILILKLDGLFILKRQGYPFSSLKKRLLTGYKNAMGKGHRIQIR